MNGSPSAEPRSLLTAEEFARFYEGKRAELVVDPGRRRAEIHAPGVAVRMLAVADVLSTELLPGLEIRLVEVLPVDE